MGSEERGGGVKARAVDERKKDGTSSVKGLSFVDEQTTTHVALLLLSLHTSRGSWTSKSHKIAPKKNTNCALV